MVNFIHIISSNNTIKSLFIPLILALGITACEDDPVEGNEEELQYTVTLLPTLGGTSAAGNGINEQGWITGNSTLSGDQIIHAAVWRNGTITDLGTLGGPDLHSNMVWPGSNEQGMLVGISETEQMDTNGDGTNFSCDFFFPGEHTGHVCRGFLWEDGVMTKMPTLEGANSFALNINNLGQVVGWAETEVNGPTCNTDFQVKQFRAVIWEPLDDQITELPPLPGDSVSTANVINDNGLVAGISGNCGIAVGGVSARHQVYWENGVPVKMGTLGGVNWHTPMAINEKGVVVGFSNPPEVTDGSFIPHAYYWTKSDGIHDLGVLPGDASSQALGINEQGQIVGLSHDAEGNNTAVIWNEKSPESIQDLSELVSDDFTGHLLYANDINNKGVIVGGAIDPATGDTVAYRAVPTGEN